MWNVRSAKKKLMKLAGHLMGQALQKYNLPASTQIQSLESAVEEMHGNLEPSSKLKLSRPKILEMVCRKTWSWCPILSGEWNVRLALHMAMIQCPVRLDTLLCCQLKEGLRYELMKAPVVSGATK